MIRFQKFGKFRKEFPACPAWAENRKERAVDHSFAILPLRRNGYLFFFFLFLKDYNNWWLLMRYLSSFALSRGREPKSIPPFCSSTRQISRLTNSLYKYTFFIPPFLGGSIQFIITHWDCTRVQFQFPI